MWVGGGGLDTLYSVYFEGPTYFLLSFGKLRRVLKWVRGERLGDVKNTIIIASTGEAYKLSNSL